MNIGTKIISGFLAIALFVALIGMNGFLFSHNVRKAFDHVALEIMPVQEMLANLTIATHQIVESALVHGFPAKAPADAGLIAAEGFSNPATEEEDIRTGTELFRASAGQLERLIAEYQPEHNDLAAVILHAGQRLQDISGELIDYHHQGVIDPKLQEKKEELVELEQHLLQAVNGFMQHEKSKFKVNREIVDSTINNIATTIIFACALTILAALLTGLLVSRSIARPIRKLRDMAVTIGRGDLAVQVEIGAKGEIGDLAASLNKMVNDLAVSLTKEKELAAAGAKVKAEREKTMELQEAILSRDMEIRQRLRAEEEIERNYKTQAIINRMLHLSLKNKSLQETLDSYIDLVLSLPHLGLEPKGAILLVEDEKDTLRLKVFRGLAHDLMTLCNRVPFGRCLCGRAAETGHILFAGSVDERHDISYPGMPPHGHYCVPICSASNETLGVLTCYVKEGHKRDYQVEEILSAVADVIASTIDRLRSLEDSAKMEIKLQQAQKMEAIGTLAGGITHDFNNILSAILGFTGMAMDEALDGSRAKADLLEVIKAGNRARELVRQILTFSRQSEQDLQPVLLPPLVKEVLKLLRSTIPATIQIRQDIDTGAGAVMADPTQIHQVLMNLCTNAYHAMGEKNGILDVCLKAVKIGPEDSLRSTGLDPGSYLRLTVSDTGCGMDQAVIKKIFDPYFTTKPKGKGTGLGLSVVHGIVKSHGGAVTVYSEPGRGSSFNVYLPRLEKQQDIPVDSVAGPVPRGNEHILIVDDEEQLVLMMRRMLEAMGYRITSRTSSVEALEAFRHNPAQFDLVITDMTMPNMTGVQLAAKLLEIRPMLPIILCTGFSEAVNQAKAKAMGIRHYVNKPVIKAEIARIIRQILDDKG